MGQGHGRTRTTEAGTGAGLMSAVTTHVLALLRARLANDAETELRVAAGEQARITKLRLEKLIDQPKRLT